VFQHVEALKEDFKAVKDKILSLVGNKITMNTPTPMDIGEVGLEEEEQYDVDVVTADTKCFRCEGWGHMSRECPSKGKGKGGGFKGGNNGKGWQQQQPQQGQWGGQFKGAGKSWGKDAGKGKGYMGTCFSCGKVGHKAAECWSKGKGKGGKGKGTYYVEGGEEQAEYEEEGNEEVDVGGVWLVAQVDAIMNEKEPKAKGKAKGDATERVVSPELEPDAEAGKSKGKAKGDATERVVSPELEPEAEAGKAKGKAKGDATERVVSPELEPEAKKGRAKGDATERVVSSESEPAGLVVSQSLRDAGGTLAEFLTAKNEIEKHGGEKEKGEKQAGKWKEVSKKRRGKTVGNKGANEEEKKKGKKTEKSKSAFWDIAQNRFWDLAEEEEVTIAAVETRSDECGMMFHVTDATKMLASVNKMVKAGNRVVFGVEDSYVENLKTKRRIKLKKERGVYVMEVVFKNGESEVKGRIVVDSGAAECVMPNNVLRKVELMEKTQGVKFMAANGGTMENYGRKLVEFRPVEEEEEQGSFQRQVGR
jgi:hypothetical protein